MGMEKSKGRYYLGRIHKMGMVNDESIAAAIASASGVKANRYSWTITDAVLIYDDKDVLSYAFGKLSKYRPDGSVTVVDESQRSQDKRVEPNLLAAASPFVYIPEFSGIAFLHVWNQVETKAFIRWFCRIIEHTHNSFFASCEIEPISDLRTFMSRLQSVDQFTEISARVHPPNPLFGRAWKSLREYIERRNADELRVHEKSPEGKGLVTKVVLHVIGILSQNKDQVYQPEEPIDITDAAVLMAADGYGKGKIVGKEGKTTIVIRTSDTQSSFVFDKDPDHTQLYEVAKTMFLDVNSERSMRHGNEETE